MPPVSPANKMETNISTVVAFQDIKAPALSHASLLYDTSCCRLLSHGVIEEIEANVQALLKQEWSKSKEEAKRGELVD